MHAVGNEAHFAGNERQLEALADHQVGVAVTGEDLQEKVLKKINTRPFFLGGIWKAISTGVKRIDTVVNLRLFSKKVRKF